MVYRLLIILLLSGCSSTKYINNHDSFPKQKVCNPEKFTEEEKKHIRLMPSIGERIKRNNDNCDDEEIRLNKDINAHNEEHEKEG